MTIVIGRQLKFVNHAMPSTTSMSPNKTQIKLPTDEVKGGEAGHIIFNLLSLGTSSLPLGVIIFSFDSTTG